MNVFEFENEANVQKPNRFIRKNSELAYSYHFDETILRCSCSIRHILEDGLIKKKTYAYSKYLIDSAEVFLYLHYEVLIERISFPFAFL